MGERDCVHNTNASLSLACGLALPPYASLPAWTLVSALQSNNEGLSIHKEEQLYTVLLRLPSVLAVACIVACGLPSNAQLGTPCCLTSKKAHTHHQQLPQP